MTKRKTNILIILFSGLLLTIGSFTFFLLDNNTLTISFYKINEESQIIFKKIIAETINNTQITYNEIEQNEPLSKKILKNTDLLITRHTLNSDILSQEAIEFDSNILNNFPQTIKNTGLHNNKLCAIPLALDHFEISYNNKLLRVFGDGNHIRDIKQLEEFARFSKEKAPESKFPFVVAGGDDSTALLFISAITEALYGKEGYDELIADIQNLDETPMLDKVLEDIKKWEQAEFIHPNWLEITNDKLLTYIELEKPAVIFMPLSFHRTIPLTDIRQYTTSWIPCAQNLESRSLILPTIIGVPLNNKLIESSNNDSQNINAEIILKKLASQPVQEIITEKTKLAPTHSTAQALDKQASDVRLWAAASKQALPSIEEVFKTDTEVKQFADWLREKK